MNYEAAYAKALEEKQRRLAAETSRYDDAVQNFYDTSAEYRDIVTKLSGIGSELLASVFSGDNESFERLSSEAKKLGEAKKALLLAAGINGIVYECELCKDTGYCGTSVCDCVKNAAAQYLLDDSAGIASTGEFSFDKFDLDYYPEDSGAGASPRKRMASILAYVREYTDNFSRATSENLLFVGNTGLGKTFLSLSVFNDLVRRGHNVIYMPSFNLFSKIESEHFGKKDGDTYNEAIECDLLIIDDLGSEFVSSFTKSVFGNIVNSRLISSKPTVISTNLSLQEIEKTYSPRVSSRILGNYTVKKFLGKDIRQIKKIKNQT